MNGSQNFNKLFILEALKKKPSDVLTTSLEKE